MACPMVSIKNENTSQITRTRTKIHLINRITKIRREAEIRTGITKVSTGIKRKIGINIVQIQ